MAKSLISAVVYGSKEYGSQEGFEIKGRCLGYISSEELAKLLESKRIQKKMFTAQTVSVQQLAKINNDRLSAEDLNGHRLIFALTKIGDKSIFGKKLFVTEPYEYITEFRDNVYRSQVMLSGKSGCIYIKKEI
jgi:hypothetical protein